MKVHIPFSNSSGNTCRVFNDTASILIDCGVSMAQLFKHGKFDVDTIFITHAHTDHISGVGGLGRATDAKIYTSPEALEVRLGNNRNFFKGCDVTTICEGDSVVVGSLSVTAHKTSHDSPGSLYYTVDYVEADTRFGLVTDTGVYLPEMESVLDSCDALLLESNHDQDMLEDFPGYSPSHKKRIKSSYGHVSNDQTCEFIDKHIDLDTKQWIAFGHLSENTNRPQLVLDNIKNAFPQYDRFSVAPSREILVIEGNGRV
ncbi:MBL fold metallo-hydrolase [Candidatus Neomarinimicrobiota bacterium]